MAQRLHAAYQWSLLSVEELVAQTLAHLPAEPTDPALYKALLDGYTVALYDACRHREQQARCELAYRELYQLLLRSAYKTRPDLAPVVAEEVAQRALVLVFEQLDRCQQPQSFIAFALYKLRQAFTEHDRYMAKMLDSGVAALVEPTAPIHTHHVWRSEEQQHLQRAALETALAALTDARMRQVILWKFVEGWRDEEIAEQLGLTANHVRVLRNRGLAQLRQLLAEEP
jgi:RNA polymerase sigma factor (sigma-70 family)